MTKQEEYTLMQTSKPYDLVTPVTGGKTIKWLKVWDHRADPNTVTFKTQTVPPYKHKLITIEEIDLMPVANKKIFKVIIKKR